MTPPLLGEFAQFEEFGRLLDESTILRFRHRLEAHKLAEKILQVVSALLSERGLLLKAGTALGVWAAEGFQQTCSSAQITQSWLGYSERAC